MKKKIFLLGSAALALTPFLAFAQTDVCEANGGSTSYGIGLIICRIGVFINSAVPILITLGVVYFIWGVISYAIAKDEEAKTKGRGAMIWGLIAILVIVSIWALVGVIQRTFNVNDTENNPNINIPCIPSPGNTCPTN